MKQQSITLFAKWRVREGELENVLSLLAEAAVQSRQEEGNLFYRIHQGITERNTLMLYEGYKDEASLAAHRSSEHFQTLVLGKIVPLLEHRESVVTNELI